MYYTELERIKHNIATYLNFYSFLLHIDIKVKALFQILKLVKNWGWYIVIVVTFKKVI